MNILLTHGFFLKADKSEQKIMRPYPPLGLLYVSAYLEQNNIEHHIFDSTFESPESLNQFIDDLQPSVVGFYATFLTRPNIVRIIQRIRNHRLLNGTRIIIGGPDARYNINEYLSVGADFILPGEGEITLFELLKQIKCKSDFEYVKGIAYLDSNGKTFLTEERPHITDLNTLPFPNRKIIDINKYINAWKSVHGYSALSINSQRGCPFTCRWCSRAVFGSSYRRRNPHLIVDEIEHLLEIYNPDRFWFVDDVFTMDRHWINIFAEELEKRSLKIAFECISRPDRLDKSSIKVLKNAGCKMLWIGAESGSQKVIDLMDRKIDIRQAKEIMLAARSFGIMTGTFIMLGYPGETLADIRETAAYLKKSNPDEFTINTAYPVKGTDFFKDIEPLIDKQYNWKTTPDRDIDFIKTFRRRFYDLAIRWVFNDFSWRKNLTDKKVLKTLKFRLKTFILGLMIQLYKK